MVLPPHLRLVASPQLAAILVAAFATDHRSGDASQDTTGSSDGGEFCAPPSSESRASDGLPAGGLPAMPAAWPSAFVHARGEARHARWASAAPEHQPEEEGGSTAVPQQGRRQGPVGGGAGEEDTAGEGGAADGEHDTAAAAAAVEVGTPADAPAPPSTARAAITSEAAPQATDAAATAVAPGPSAAPAAPPRAAPPAAPGPQCLEITDPESAWRQLTQCSMVVGMHPDQARGEVWAGRGRQAAIVLQILLVSVARLPGAGCRPQISLWTLP